MIARRRTVPYWLVIAMLLLPAGCSTVSQDLGGAGGLGSALISDAAISAIIQAPDPITTGFGDTHAATNLPAGFGDNLTPLPLAQQPRDASGAYLLAPGFYEMTARSYCLHAGDRGPSQGDGYLYAPMAGSATGVIEALIRNSEAKTDIPQTTVQLLIWAVLAQAKFDSLSND